MYKLEHYKIRRHAAGTCHTAVVTRLVTYLLSPATFQVS